MKDLGKVKKVLNIKIKRERVSGKVRLIQKGYLQKVPQKFNINDDTKYICTLLAPHFKFRASMSPTIV